MLELLAPAGSPEAVVAAVQNGADAVYLGFSEFNARRNAKDFTDEDLYKAAQYCRIRGVKLYAALNILVTDRELIKVEHLAKKANRLGVDAVLVQDFGALSAIKQAVPDMPVHASTQMSVHNLDGVRMAAKLGASRVVVARELSKAHIAYICKHSPVEIEVFVHGALCMSYSGQCYMSGVTYGRSGNRGLCAQPCRQEFSTDGDFRSPLSLKDCCLVNHLEDLKKCGVTGLKIEGRMKRPEYTAIVTSIYSTALRAGRGPTEEELRQVAAAFSGQGFTDGYFEGKKGPDMLAIRGDADKTEPPSFRRVRSEYLLREQKIVPLRFSADIRRYRPAEFAVEDDSGNRAKITGPVPERVSADDLTREELVAQLSKTGGSPYRCERIDAALDSGLKLPYSEINKIRRALIVKITKLRSGHTAHRESSFAPPALLPNRADQPQLNISISDASQLTAELMAQRPALICIPMETIAAEAKRLRPYLEAYAENIAVILPRVISDDEHEKTRSILKNIRRMGIGEALVGNIGHAALARKAGFALRGDFGLNLFNSQSLKIIKALGFKSGTLSFELNIPQLREISKCLDTEMIVYGRLPLMVTENPIVTDETRLALTDRKGASFPVAAETGSRNVLLNSRKLFLADRARDFTTLGLWGYRLMFTDESPEECVRVVQRHLNMGYYEPPSYTRGLYYRGVE